MARSEEPDLRHRVTELEKSYTFFNTHIRQLEMLLSQNLKSSKDNAKALFKIESSYNHLEKYVHSLEDYCLELDMGLRRKHLILTGVTETEKEKNGPDENNTQCPTHEVAFETLSNLVDTLLFNDIDVAYRIGRTPVGDKPRPLLVKFCRESVRNEVNDKRKNFKDSDATTNTFVNPDLPAKISRQRADLRSVVSNARAKNVPAKTMGDKVCIDNVTYSHKNLDQLPEGLRLSNAKSLLTPKGLAFQGEHVFLSNFYHIPVKVNGHTFISAEQAYQHDRATFIGKHNIATDLLAAQSSREAKKTSKRIDPSATWDLVKYDRMKHIVQQKFKQHPSLQDALVNTGANPLIEATYDKFWGCGLPLTARDLKEGKWFGRNCLGSILVDIRTEIKRERAAAVMTNPQSNNNGQTDSTRQDQVGAPNNPQVRVTPTRQNTRRPDYPPPKPPRQAQSSYSPPPYPQLSSARGFPPIQSSPPLPPMNSSYPSHSQMIRTPSSYTQNPPPASLYYSQVVQAPPRNDSYTFPGLIQPSQQQNANDFTDSQRIRDQQSYTPVLSPTLGAFGYQSQQYFSQPAF